MRRWLGPFVLGAAAALLFWGERRRPLRRREAPGPERVTRNVALAAASFGSLAVVHSALIPGVLAWSRRHRVGLVRQLPLPRAARLALSVALLDYTLWHWHRVNHTVPFLWQFHALHHADPDLDVTTGPRFDPRELSLSVLFRALQVLTIGADEEALVLWQRALFLCILFHHSNLRLPGRLEWWLVQVVVTPRMHGIHHSDVLSEMDSNWSSLLSVWDRLHGTFRLNVPQDVITIGLPTRVSR